MPTFTAELAVARDAAERAGRLIAGRWNTADVNIDYKGEVDLVTEVDLAAEQVLIETIGAAFPADTLLAEEGSGAAGSSGRVWHIDPLDGTTNFSHGLPHFCVSVALFDAEGPAVGVVHDPIRNWTFHAQRGGGAWLNGTRLRVSNTTELGRAVIATGFPYDRRTNPDNNTDRFGAFVPRVQGVRRAGSAALDLAWLAAGWLDVYWEDRLKSWDLAAGLLLVLEAGGTVTDLFGAPFDLTRGRLTATNGALHAATVDLLTHATKESARAD